MTLPPYGDVDLNEDTERYIEREWKEFLSHIESLGFTLKSNTLEAQLKSESPHSMSNRIIFHADGNVKCIFRKKDEKI